MLFLFPWAVAYQRLDLFAFVAMTIFILLLTIDLFILWRKGALEWT